MTPIDVRIERLGKQYRLGTRRNAGSFWALKNVTFDVPRGASVGVIGRNGAGKSTLLKLLAGITAPTSGSIVIAPRLLVTSRWMIWPTEHPIVVSAIAT